MLAHSIVYITKKGALIINVCLHYVYLGRLHIIIEYVDSEGEPPVCIGVEKILVCIVGECILAKIIRQSFSISVLIPASTTNH